MNRYYSFLFLTVLLLANAQPGIAHFGMIIPAQPVVSPYNRTLHLQLSFGHPFYETGIDLAKPKRFYAIHDDNKIDLLDSLIETKVMNHLGWQTNFEVKRPGVYQFVMEPTPYWEPTENLFIIHYTKVIIPAFGFEDGWQQPIGLPLEILPLLRPFGNYAGNSFTGQALFGGKPMPGAEIEVEFYNQGQQVKAATDYHITQIVKADDTGIFTFTCPLAGWWGFAALKTADYTLPSPMKEEKQIELGAVLWIYMDSYRTQQPSK